VEYAALLQEKAKKLVERAGKLREAAIIRGDNSDVTTANGNSKRKSGDCKSSISKKIRNDDYS
jgi:hypothetical protein